MKYKSLFKQISLLSLVFCMLSSCNKQQTYVPGEVENRNIKVGAMAGPEADLVRAAADVAKQKFDLDVEIVEFTDYVSPNAALADGSIDANAYQTVPYMEEAKQTRGYDFVSVGKTFLYPIGLYSKKHASIKELPKSIKIGIPNDPSNESRALLLLEEAGLLELPENIGMKATVMDVTEKPEHPIEIVTLEAAQIPRVLEDLDLGVINTNYAVPAGLNPSEDALFIESTDSPYTNIIVAQASQKDHPNIEKFVVAYQSQLVIDTATKLFGEKAIPGFTPQ